MPLSVTHPFSGADSQSCSYTTNFISSHADQAKALGMTEAQYEKHLVQGAWGVAKGKIEAGTMNDGDIIFRMKYNKGADEYTISHLDDVLKLTNKSTGGSATWDPKKFEDFFLDNPDYALRLPAASGPAVSNASKAVGAMTDQDAATLFVKVKDDFAKLKGVSVKGANAALDFEVYASIGAQSGYTGAELAAKVERYKADGHKLSSLKKKVLSGKVKVKEFEKTVLADAPAADAKAVVTNNVPAPSANAGLKKAPAKYDSSVTEYTMNGHKVGTVSAAEDSLDAWGGSIKGKGFDITKVNADGSTSVGFHASTKKGADDMLAKHSEQSHFKQPMESVHTSASKTAADNALADLKAKDEAQSLVFTDEEVSKAYIKAKDELASSTENPWTLYTQKNSEFEKAIYNLMDKSYGIDMSPVRIKQQIASYLGDGNKLSVLKKKMAKTGEHKPLADTLKKTKAQKLAGTPTTTSASTMKAQVDDFAHSGFTPSGAADHSMKPSVQGTYSGLQNTVAAYKDASVNYEAFLKSLKDLEAKGYSDFSILDIVRSYDMQKAKALGVENTFFYEKKMAEWASSPNGKAYILQKKTTEEILANLPPLPRSSAGYPTETTVNEARRIQRDMGAWSGTEQSALRTYTGGSYHAMNGALRRGESLSTSIRNAQKGMRATTEKMFSHRGTSWSQFGMHSVDEAYKLIGKTVVDKGFLSTSVGPSAAFGGQVKLEIEVAEGTYAAFVKDISNFTHENELLLAHGTQYQVLSVTPPNGAYGATTIRIRTIPGSHGK